MLAGGARGGMKTTLLIQGSSGVGVDLAGRRGAVIHKAGADQAAARQIHHCADEGQRPRRLDSPGQRADCRDEGKRGSDGGEGGGTRVEGPGSWGTVGWQLQPEGMRVKRKLQEQRRQNSLRSPNARPAAPPAREPLSQSFLPRALSAKHCTEGR
jgi:hypothetical protein